MYLLWMTSDGHIWLSPYGGSQLPITPVSRSGSVSPNATHELEPCLSGLCPDDEEKECERRRVGYLLPCLLRSSLLWTCFSTADRACYMFAVISHFYKALARSLSFSDRVVCSALALVMYVAQCVDLSCPVTSPAPPGLAHCYFKYPVTAPTPRGSLTGLRITTLAVKSY